MWLTKNKLKMLKRELRCEIMDIMKPYDIAHADLIIEFTKWQVSVNNELKAANIKLAGEIEAWQAEYTKSMQDKADKMYAQLNEYIAMENNNREGARIYNERHHSVVESFCEGIHDSLVAKNNPAVSKLRLIAEAALALVKDWAGDDAGNWDRITDALNAAGYDTGYTKI